MKPDTDGLAPGIFPVQQDPDITGVPAGTLVMTRRGAVAVETLDPGDHIITRNTGFAPLTHIQRDTVEIPAILITAGSLGPTQPEHDLILPAAQPVLVRDWRARAIFGQAQALVRAEALTDGEFIRALGPREMQLIRLHFDRPRVIYAGGLELGAAILPVSTKNAA